MKISQLRVVAMFTMALLLTAGTTKVIAQPADVAQRCTPDAMRLCSEFIPDADRITACLHEKRHELSPGCSSVFFSPKRKRHAPVKKE